MTARARGTRKNRRADDAEEGALLELLTHGLSEDEIRRVVACALLALDEGGRDRLVARLGEETGRTLRRLLGSHGRSGTKARPSPGGAKIRQEWEKAWGDWEACVAESGDEHGRYVVREHHWEEPGKGRDDEMIRSGEDGESSPSSAGKSSPARHAETLLREIVYSRGYAARADSLVGSRASPWHWRPAE